MFVWIFDEFPRNLSVQLAKVVGVGVSVPSELGTDSLRFDWFVTSLTEMRFNEVSVKNVFFVCSQAGF